MKVRMFYYVLVTAVLSAGLRLGWGEPLGGTAAACLSLACMLEVLLMRQARHDAIKEAVVDVAREPTTTEEMRTCMEMMSEEELHQAVSELIAERRLARTSKYFHPPLKSLTLEDYHEHED